LVGRKELTGTGECATLEPMKKKAHRVARRTAVGSSSVIERNFLLILAFGVIMLATFVVTLVRQASARTVTITPEIIQSTP
jgi:hypothetical protein